MRDRHSADEILTAAIEVAFDDGLGQLTFGRVGKRLGIADRTVVYYFPTKDELVAAVLATVGERLMIMLAPVFTQPATDHRELAARAWAALRDPATAPIFALYLEASSLAAIGRQPYRTLAPALTDGWISWAAELLPGRRTQRRAEAAAAVAILDGLLMLRAIAGEDTAAAAARRLGL
ncbi:MAG TPA: helix-turn-helix domain-containing protein [Ilumatobacteraceae bacterium]|nr:helix-turn-helix domain-containing protein [Ilumatobacteraceae bacterium]